MPPKKRPAASAASDYDSDNGFVEDVAPKSKRSKVSTKPGLGAAGDGGSGCGEGGMKGKGKDKGRNVDKDGEEFWEVCLHNLSL